MPTPERDAQSSPASPRLASAPLSAVSMNDLLASCAAATAVSTPPREECAAGAEDAGAEDVGAEDAGADKAAKEKRGIRRGPRRRVQPPARRDAA